MALGSGDAADSADPGIADAPGTVEPAAPVGASGCDGRESSSESSWLSCRAKQIGEAPVSSEVALQKSF